MKLRRCGKPIMKRKKFIDFIIFLLTASLLVWGTYDTLNFLSYQNLGNAPLMLKNYIKILYFKYSS